MSPPLHQLPRYLQLAQTLIAEIEAGAYPVGQLIPTEHALCDQFGASRFTVREAIKRLVQMGMVTRQAGVGTRVVGRRQEVGYRQTLEGLADLERFTDETRLHILSRQTLEVSGDLAGQLGARPGEAWLSLEALRRNAKGTVFALTRVYIHPAFRGLDLTDAADHTPIYARIERQFSEKIAEMRQQIDAIAIDPDSAKLLGVRSGSAGLRMTRAYVNMRGEIVELAINIHPADRFTYSQTFHRDERGVIA